MTYKRAPAAPMCKYGVKCYRKKPEHWLEFDHPDDHPFLLRLAANDACPEPVPAPAKRAAQESAHEPAPKRPTPAASGGAAASSAAGAAAPTTRAALVFAPGAGGLSVCPGRSSSLSACPARTPQCRFPSSADSRSLSSRPRSSPPRWRTACPRRGAWGAPAAGLKSSAAAGFALASAVALGARCENSRQITNSR